MNRYTVVKNSEGEDVCIENAEYNKHLQNEKYQLFLKNSGIPQFYWNIEFKDCTGEKDKKEIDKIKYYADHCYEEKFNYVSLYIWGIHGVKKTSLLCAIGKHAIKHGMRVKFILAGDLISKLMKLNGFNRDEEIEAEIEDLKQCDMLLIDDFGDIEKSLSWGKSNHIIIAEWDTFLRKIISSGVKLVISSNFSLDSLKENFGGSIVELLDRNSEQIQLVESVKHKRKLSVKKAFEGVC